MDFVLVDAPPLLTVSDAATLSTRVDAIIVVVRLGVVNRPMLRDLAREIDASPAPKLGFILTGAGPTELYGMGAYGYRGKPEPRAGQSLDVLQPSPFADAGESLVEQQLPPRVG
jgi:non-specific protein-tyrosine kinase